jgi:hypothetical protein
MSRAGREPAEDIKRRIVAACQEVGLTIKSARMYLCDDHTRIIYVYALTPDDPHPPPVIQIMALVHVSGSWSGKVDIKCSAEKQPNMWAVPTMRGRHEVPLNQLVGQLQATVEEREQVVAAIRMGVDGPYRFKHARWERPGDPFTFT